MQGLTPEQVKQAEARIPEITKMLVESKLAIKKRWWQWTGGRDQVMGEDQRRIFDFMVTELAAVNASLEYGLKEIKAIIEKGAKNGNDGLVKER